MAKLLMSCDDYIIRFNGCYYARNQERLSLYQRYLRVFDKLRLVTRCTEKTSLESAWVPLSEEPRIEYSPMPFFQGPWQYAKQIFNVKRSARNAVKGCDAAILRLPSTVSQSLISGVQQEGIPYATEIVYDAKDGYESESSIIAKLLWYRIHHVMQRACAKAKGVSCVTQYYLQKHYFSKLPDSFCSHYSSISLDESFFTAPRKYPQGKTMVITHVCNQVMFEGRKGHNRIIEALQILKEKGIKVVCKFVGPDYQNGIEKLIAYARELGVEDMVQFLGRLNRQQISDYLNESDIYVMPTKAEGLPRVIIEAIAKGLPCITTPVSGNPELVDSHFLVEYQDVKTLAKRIEELVTNAKLYEDTSEASFKRSLGYEASILQGRRDEFYTKLLACCK